MKIGPFEFHQPIILAPMAGVTDLPFRKLCRQYGADMAISEMVSANPLLRKTKKTQLRLNHDGEPEPRAVQIAGGDAQMMADAARYNADNGAQIIDINMGCPAKKICNKAAGSALLKNERLVAKIIEAVVSAVNIPVTLKIRTGWDKDHKNGLTIAQIAQSSGIQALAVHGRTRACGYGGVAEYDSIADIKSRINIPVIANGDITTAQQAKQVIEYTGADGIMIARAAQGNPWIFRDINDFLATGTMPPTITTTETKTIMMGHIRQLHTFYGHYLGVRIARKHVSWYCKATPNSTQFRANFNKLECANEQLALTSNYFNQLLEGNVTSA